MRAGQASYDVMAEFLKWLEAGEESIFSLDTEKNLPGASCELPEAAARAENPRNKIFPMSCRIPVWPFVVVVKAGLTTPAGNNIGEEMPQYLVAIQHPDNYDPSAEGEAMVRDIDVLNEEMEAAGARFFAGGLQSAPHAKSLRKQSGGEVIITDGPYLEAKEHIGGFWILDAANMDEAVAWGRKAVVACRASVEVREFLAMPTE